MSLRKDLTHLLLLERRRRFRQWVMTQVRKHVAILHAMVPRYSTMYNPCHSYLYLLVRCQRRQYSLLKEGVVSYHPDRVAVSVSCTIHSNTCQKCMYKLASIISYLNVAFLFHNVSTALASFGMFGQSLQWHGTKCFSVRTHVSIPMLYSTSRL